jgi:tetratricopeptide (TPR) repeat protein
MLGYAFLSYFGDRNQVEFEPGNMFTILGSVLIFPLALLLIYLTNISVVQADTLFKIAEPFSENGQWEIAAILYSEAIGKAPKQDQYYLFLGKIYLEQAKQAQNPSNQTSLVLHAKEQLEIAQHLNPLNTDHTANLARLYGWWANAAADPTQRVERAQVAAKYFEQTIRLSPNNPAIWGERANLYLKIFNDLETASKFVEKSIQLDPKYGAAHALAGDIQVEYAKTAEDLSERDASFTKAIVSYRTAADLSTGSEKANYLITLSNVLIETGESRLADQSNIYDSGLLNQAIEILKEALNEQISPQELVNIQAQIARIYIQLEDPDNEQLYLDMAYKNASEEQAIFLDQIQSEIRALP